jgi:hypothetical protein
MLFQMTVAVLNSDLMTQEISSLSMLIELMFYGEMAKRINFLLKFVEAEIEVLCKENQECVLLGARKP